MRQDVESLIRTTSDRYLRETTETVERAVKDRKEFQPDQLLERFLVKATNPPEEKVPGLKPLKLLSFMLESAPNQSIGEPGYRSEVYLTNKRLFLVENGLDQAVHNPRLIGDETRETIDVTSRFAQSVTPFVLNNIYGITMQMETKSNRRAHVERVKVPVWLKAILALTIVGLSILFFCQKVEYLKRQKRKPNNGLSA